MTPEPGDFFVTSTGGLGGLTIGVLESAIMDDWDKGPSKWRHAGIYLGGGMVLQAEPGGAVIVARRPNPADIWSTGVLPLTPAQRALVPALAESYRGIGYSWLDYAALGAHHGHVPDLPVWPEGDHLVTLQQFIESTHHQMCSFMVDNFRLRLGDHLFGTQAKPPTPSRWSGYVMPWDLGHLLETQGAK
jgi:hypothetical protein